MVSVLFYLMTAGLCCCHRRDQPSSGHCHIVTSSLPTPAQPPPRHLDTFLATPEGRTFMHRNKLLLLNRLSALVMSTHNPLHYLSVSPGRCPPSDTAVGWPLLAALPPRANNWTDPQHTTEAQVASVHHCLAPCSLLLCCLVTETSSAANDPSVFTITETWLKAPILLALSHLRHFAKQALTHSK